MPVVLPLTSQTRTVHVQGVPPARRAWGGRQRARRAGLRGSSSGSAAHVPAAVPPRLEAV